MDNRLINILREVHKCTGRGGRVGGAVAQSNSDFLGAAREIWAKSVFKEVSKSFYYFEEIDIFHFNLKSAWWIQVNSRETAVA